MSFFRRVADCDVSPVVAELDAQPDLWNTITLRRDAPNSPHSEMSDIWVRYNDIRKFTDNYLRLNDEHVPIWYPAWYRLPSLRPIVFGLMTLVQGEMLGGILITKIPPGKGIARHVDRGWHVDYYDKFYVQLRNAEGASFCFDGEAHTPKPGEIWMVDNREPHWIENNSSEDRMTLIVCIRTEIFGRK